MISGAEDNPMAPMVSYLGERGQAMIEAMAGAIVIGAFVAGIFVAGRWHAKSVDVLEASLAQAFLMSMGKRDLDPSARHKHDAPNASLPEVVPGYRVIDSLRREWQIDSPGQIIASVGEAPVVWHAQMPGWIPAPRIVRHSYVVGGTGHGKSDVQVQSHVAGSATAWTNVAHHSRELLRHSGGRLRPVDEAWRRPAPDTDWLSRWTGFVPTRLLQRAAE